jgi:hypothetical protein
VDSDPERAFLCLKSPEQMNRTEHSAIRVFQSGVSPLLWTKSYEMCSLNTEVRRAERRRCSAVSTKRRYLAYHRVPCQIGEQAISST